MPLDKTLEPGRHAQLVTWSGLVTKESEQLELEPQPEEHAVARISAKHIMMEKSYSDTLPRFRHCSGI